MEKQLFPIPEPVNAMQCTYAVNGKRQPEQPIYYCHTCGLDNSDPEDEKGICEACAYICHAGHDLEFVGNIKGFICDCGSSCGKQPCICCAPGKAHPCCTSTISPGFTRQRMWYCRTCGLQGKNGCCTACAKICHNGHKVVDMGIIDKFECDCGTSKCKCKCVCKNPPKSKYPPLRPPFPWEPLGAPNVVAPYRN